MSLELDGLAIKFGELFRCQERFGGQKEVVFFVAEMPLEDPVQTADSVPEFRHLAWRWLSACREKARGETGAFGRHLQMGAIERGERGAEFGMPCLDLDVLIEKFFHGCGGGVIEAEGRKKNFFFFGDVQFEPLLHEPFEVVQAHERFSGKGRVIRIVYGSLCMESGSIDNGINLPVFAGEASHRLESDFNFGRQKENLARKN